MTDKAIQDVLDRLNSGKHNDIVNRPIAKNVWWGYVWGETDQGYGPEGQIQNKGFEFYFVKAKDNRFAGAVFRMGANEMHWYVDEKYRGKGILVGPLRNIILPFIFRLHADENEQEAGIEPGPFSKISTKLARKVGFRCVEEKDGRKKFVLKRKRAADLKLKNRPKMKVMELRALEDQTKKAFRQVRMIIDKLKVKQFDPFEASFPNEEDYAADLAMMELESLVTFLREKAERAESSKSQTFVSHR
jgi:hypothetical protein